MTGKPITGEPEPRPGAPPPAPPPPLRPVPPQQIAARDIPAPPSPPQARAAAAPAPARPGNAARADYPKMLYNVHGATMTVPSAEVHDRMRNLGWDTVPPPTFYRPKPTQSPITSGGADALAQIVRSVIESVLDERGFPKKGD